MSAAEERRRVAKALREPSNLLDLNASLYDALDMRPEVVETTIPYQFTEHNNRRLLNRLADLIDVPTTVLDLTETTRTVHGEEVRGWECRECGQSCEEMYGSYEFCPHCRRKVDRCEGMDMEKKKKTAMISQPMRGKTDEEIYEVRNRIAAKLQEFGCEVFDTVFHFTDEQMDGDGVKNKEIYYIANSILAMSRCDCVYFAKGWENARGCRIEHFIAATYGMDIIYER